MDRYLDVRTPESVAFSYELAGLGSRFLAVMVDLLIQIAILVAIVWGLSLLAAGAPHASRGASKLAASIGEAIIAVIVFLVFFGYFIAFEAFWNGRTPGKKLLGLRVVRDGGYSVDFAASAIRNLIRVGEATLGFYAISAISTLVSPENKRLGDIAAGTIVVRESRMASLATVLEDAREAPRTAMLTYKEHSVIDQFVARRKSLDPYVRMRLAYELASRVRSRVSADLQRLDDEELLERLSAS